MLKGGKSVRSGWLESGGSWLRAVGDGVVSWSRPDRSLVPSDLTPEKREDLENKKKN